MKILSLSSLYKKPEAKKTNTKSAQNPINNNFNLGFYLKNVGNLNKSTINFTSSKGFEETLPKYFRLIPDKYQIDAAKGIYEGLNTIVTAPTGTGKTLIAEYAINKNLDEEKRTFYTTPLKALSNQKYHDFCKLYGEKNVGLMTGDIKINPLAPVIVMTTEIYRNMLLGEIEKQNGLKDIGTVIFDEFHYMNDRERGSVWEESVMFTPKDVQMLALSATVANNKKIAEWMHRINPDKKVKLVDVSPTERHVPLSTLVFDPYNPKELNPLFFRRINVSKLFKENEDHKLSDRKKETLAQLGKITTGIESINAGLEALQQIKPENGLLTENELIENLLEKEVESDEAVAIAGLLIDNNLTTVNEQISIKNSKDYKCKQKPMRLEALPLIDALSENNLLPSIAFIFSRKGCDEALEEFLSSEKYKSKKSLVTPEEKNKIVNIIKEFREKNVYLGSNFSIEGLLKGAGVHHAGCTPAYKSLVEKLFQKKLLKVVFATDTLAAGINMPAKSVVITALKKAAGKRENGEINIVELDPSTFHQISGRAGRRGIDKIGWVVVAKRANDSLKIATSLALSNPSPIKSNFTPSYGFITSFLNANPDIEKLEEVISKSFMVDSAPNNKTDKAKVITGIKKDLSLLCNILEKNEYIKNIHPDYPTHFEVTERGKVISQLRGINEVFFGELLFKNIFNNCTPEELAAIVSAIAKPARTFQGNENDYKHCLSSENYKKIAGRMHRISGIAKDLSKIQNKQNLKLLSTDITINKPMAPFVYQWACSKEENSHDEWQGIIEDLKDSKVAEYDGDFIKTITSTIDLLNQIASISNMYSKFEQVNDYDFAGKKAERLKETAKKAIELLNKSPVMDLVQFDE